jgi:hypothetical protein
MNKDRIEKLRQEITAIPTRRLNVNERSIPAYLLTDSPLVVQPILARALGWQQALVLQQLQFWISQIGIMIGDKCWIGETNRLWQENVWFQNLHDIPDLNWQRAWRELLEKDIVEVGYNQDLSDRYSYRIDYVYLDKIVDEHERRREKSRSE